MTSRPFSSFCLKADAGAAQIGFGGDGAEVVFDGGVAVVRGRETRCDKNYRIRCPSPERSWRIRSPRATSPFSRAGLFLQAVALGGQGFGAFARRIPDLVDERQVRREEQRESDGDHFFPNCPGHVHGQVVEYQAVNCTVILSPPEIVVGMAIVFHLNVRKNLGAFQILQKFDFGLVGFGADGQFDLGAAVFELGRNADDAHARRKNLFEVHEHFGPGKAALADQRIQEGSAVEDLFGLGGLKIGFELGLFFAIGTNFALPARNFRAQIAAGAPGSVGGVARAARK